MSPRRRSPGSGGDRFTDRLRLLVAVARDGHAGGVQRYLYETGTIQSHAGLAAPQIRHADQPAGRRHIVRGDIRQPGQVLGENPAALFKLGEAVRLADHRDAGGQAEHVERRAFQVRFRKQECPDSAHPMRRLRRLAPQRVEAQVSDIAVGFDLAPDPAVMFLVDGDRLAEQGLRRLASFEIGCRLDRCEAGTKLTRHAFDEALRLNDAFQMSRRQIGAVGVSPRVRQGQAHWMLPPASCDGEIAPESAALRPSMPAATPATVERIPSGTPIP